MTPFPSKSLTIPALPRRRFSPILKVMEVHFTPEQQAKLAEIATRAGTDPEHLIKDVVLRLLEGEGETDVGRPAAELPILRLGGMGSLHRRDIYNDVR